MNSCTKGKRGERAWRDELRAQGYTARRGQQFCGGGDSPDVVCEELAARFWFEVKRVEKLNMANAMAQGIADAGAKAPVIAHKKNHGPWMVTMLASDWFKLLREALPVTKVITCLALLLLTSCTTPRQSTWFDAIQLYNECQ
jgi:Holliday junction resolvase